MVTGTSRTGRSSVVAGAVLLALGLAGIAGERMRPFGTADGALRRCIVAAGSGSLDDVLSLDRCGPIRDSAVVLAERRGQEEFRRIVGLYEAAARAGRQRFEVVVQSIVARGEAAYDSLPHREQQAVREASTNEWVLAEGFASLDSSRRAILGEPAVLSAAAVPDEVVAALGEALMDEELRGRVRGRSDAELAADPEDAHLARVRRSAGQTALAEARRQAERTGVARFPRDRTGVDDVDATPRDPGPHRARDRTPGTAPGLMDRTGVGPGPHDRDRTGVDDVDATVMDRRDGPHRG